MSLILSAPQHVFLNELDTKFKAYVGGFGCVSPDTKVWTENGLIRISEITKPTRVLSWNDKNQKFQLSLSGGSFPKGRANLYRVVTQQGEFVASGNHRSLLPSGSYSQVKDLKVGMLLSSVRLSLEQTNFSERQSECSLDVQRYLKKDEDYLGHYASEARLYGQRFLTEEESALFSTPSQGGAPKYTHLHACAGAHKELAPAHSHSALCCGRPCNLGSLNQRQRPSLRLESACLGRAYSQFDGQCCGAAQSGAKCQSNCELRQRTSLQAQDLSCCNPMVFCDARLKSQIIIAIERMEVEESYWDMQVLDTNNYITEDMTIHHNSGKTFIGCTDLLLFAGKHPKAPQAYFGCTYPSIRDIFYPTLEEAGHLLGFKVDIKTGNKECHLYRNGFYYGTIICRSMDNPGSIVGFKVARALVDEIDTLNKDKAALAWRKIIARLRFTIPNVVNGVGVTTTPEGFLFVYDKFKKEPTESYSMVQASTYENAKYLPDDYISSLLESYPEQIAQAYINGDFVNLTSGRVYTGYDRILNGSDRIWIPGEPVYIGMDFNVGQMAAVVHVKENGNPIAVDEIMGALDTPAMIESIKQRYPNTTIRIYPDASGSSRKSVDASKTDLLLLEREGWTICADKKNPFVKDRVMAVNHAFCNTSGDRVYKVNTDRCPTYADCLEQQIYNDSGEPDKKGGKDHANDAGGYFIAQDYPIDRPVANYKINFSF